MHESTHGKETFAHTAHSIHSQAYIFTKDIFTERYAYTTCNNMVIHKCTPKELYSANTGPASHMVHSSREHMKPSVVYKVHS